MIGSSAAVGEKNAEFVLSFLDDEGIPVESQDLGGTQARRIRFEPTTGRVQLKLVTDRPIEPIIAAPEPPAASGLELF
jgi:chemotaxis protein CheD